jgi:hypothetical protein
VGSSAKKRTTFSKLNRENRLREKQMEKRARKEARKLEAADSPPPVLSEAPPPAPLETLADEE